MTTPPGPVYEVSMEVDREIAAAFDEWLAAHVRDMLELPGFTSARTFAVDAEEPERVGRVTQYVLESEEALDSYVDGPAAAMRSAGPELFAGRYSVHRRVLRAADRAAATPAPACLNCGEPLRGQYCATCGQRARTRLISVWELVRDAVGDLFELDSRLWRTLGPLIFRPGKLTREYLLGRRVRFMPPFRTYLVLSLVFFLVAFFDPQQQFAVLYETPPQEAEAPVDEGTRDEVRRQVYEDLAAEGIEPPPLPGQADRSGLNVTVGKSGPEAQCDFSDYDAGDLPDWLGRRLTRERMQLVCERVTAGGGRAFANQLLDNVPASLFLLLPLMALILKILYPLSQRYYVEHLLFVLHFHAFFFLILTLEILFSRLAALLALPGWLGNITLFAVSLYIPLYLYKAMRRVYEQGRLITVAKFLLLLLSYAAGFLIILLVTVFYTAISI